MNMPPSFPNTNDELDRLLSAFYRSEMPANWPASPRPWQSAVVPSRRETMARASSRSRWALAASVAILVGGCWYLSGQVHSGKPRSDVNFDGSADAKHLKDLGKSTHKSR